MTKFNFEEQGLRVALAKPATDTRDGADIVKSRIGLESKCFVIDNTYNFLAFDLYDCDVIIVDEAQFLTAKQVDQLKLIALAKMQVICYGLKTDFQTHLFEGSKRLLEIADSITEIKSICKCGHQASINARVMDGQILRDGDQILVGGNESYKAMCYECWVSKNTY